MLVPRLYGLGDLSQILDERAYDQAEALLESLQEDLSTFVVTEVYHRAAAAIVDRGFVLLKGEPAAGKTSIAACLAMSAIDQWGCSTIKAISPAEIHQHWNPHEPTQFFWVDDAFGVGQYEAALALAWNHVFPEVRAAIRKGARFVLTSRDYIYNAARYDLKVSHFPLMDESQVVIDVHQLALEERRHILYNHLKLGQQSQEFLRAAKPYLEDVVRHVRFAPETARRLAHPLFTRNLIVTRAGILDFVQRREHLLREVLAGLDNHSRSALGLIYMAGGELSSPITLTEASSGAVSRLGSDLGGSVNALGSLNYSLVRYIRREGNYYWIFKHPTIGDAFADLILTNPELMDIYVTGMPIDRLLSQITCGDVGLQNAVIVPQNLFETILARLCDEPSEHLKLTIPAFLATRCSSRFLELYVGRNCEILQTISVSQSHVDRLLGVQLFEAGLLPEDIRRQFVENLIGDILLGRDAFLLEEPDHRGMLTSEEDDDLMGRIYDELIPYLGDIRSDWQESSNHDPEQEMGGFFEFLDALDHAFKGDDVVRGKIAKENLRATEWISERLEELAEQSPDYSDLDDRGHYAASNVTDRSVFDDIDA